VSSVAFIPGTLHARQSECLMQCTAINTIVQVSQDSLHMRCKLMADYQACVNDVSYIDCVCTTDNLSQLQVRLTSLDSLQPYEANYPLQACADCVLTDMSIPTDNSASLGDGVTRSSKFHLISTLH